MTAASRSSLLALRATARLRPCGASRRVARTSAAVAALLSQLAFGAGAPALVADLRQSGGGAGSGPDGYPHRYSATVGAYTYFDAEAAEHGIELWRSDGTSAGTTLVRDINAGRDDSDPSYLVSFAGLLYFAATDGVHGWRLWQSDGTAAGTQPLTGTPGWPNSTGRYELAATTESLYFVANDGVNGLELWLLSAPGATPMRLTDISPGLGGSVAQRMTAVDSRLFFVASDSVHGQELWVSDGTPAGTHLTRDVAPGLTGSNPGLYTKEMVASGGRLYFSADDGVHGTELWVSDGTEAGTQLVKDIEAAPGGSVPTSLTDVAGTVLFFARDAAHGVELWRSDGTDAGTRLVRDICAGVCSGSDDGLRNVASVGGRLYFPANDGVNGMELWRSDGTEAGTQLVAAINASRSSYPFDLVELNGKLVFAADDGTHGPEPWSSDGTAGGTLMLADILPGLDRSVPSGGGNYYQRDFIRSPGGVIFTADDGQAGEELWITDGTPAGTRLLRDVDPRKGSFPRAFESAPRAYFVADDESLGAQLWRSDGTAAGTMRLTTLAEGDELLGAKYMKADADGNLHFLTRTDYVDANLWRADAAADEARVVRSWTENIGLQGESQGEELATIGSTVYFYGWDEEHGSELWRSDGSDPGTFMVVDLEPGAGWSGPWPSGVAALGASLVWGPAVAQHGAEPWVSDGTPAGTRLLADIAPGSWDSMPFASAWTNAGSLLYFQAADTMACGLWKTDGTPEGTVPAIDPAAGAFVCAEFVVLGNRFVFPQTKAETGAEPWVSDGTVAGTFMLRDLAPGTSGSGPYHFVAAGDVAYFVADDGVHGRELWRTDGTPEGTELVRDIRVGIDGAAPYALTALGRTLAFAANDGAAGYELWMTNGSDIGTRLVSDIRPGAGSALPDEFTRLDDRLIFAADDLVHGVELWRMSIGDADADEVTDRVDSCLARSNPSQLETDGDGYGNACDADIAQPNDCIVNALDLAVVRAALGLTPDSPRWNPDADFNGDGVVNSADVALLSSSRGRAPGPSALSRVCQSP